MGVLIRLSAMMFLQFFVWGSWYVSTGNFLLNGAGWGEGVTGNTYSLAPIAAILAPLFLGIVADRYFASERVLGVLMLLGAVAMAAVPPLVGTEDMKEANTNLYLALIFAHTLCFMPTLGLTNTVAFGNIQNPEKQFPIVRVFGTIGWIVGNLVVSKWESVPGLNGVMGGGDLELSIDQYYVTAAASAALGIYAFTLPHTPPPAKGQKSTVGDLLGLGALKMLSSRSFLVFMVASTLLCIPLAGYYNYASAFLGDSGFRDPVAHMSFGQVSEIVFMLVMPLCFVRLGVKWMLAVGMAAWALRYGLFALAAGRPDWNTLPVDVSGFLSFDFGSLALGTTGGMILLGVLLHGVCYDFFFVTGQIYTEQKADPALRGQAQGFLVLMTQGVGLLIGAQLFGLLVSDKTIGKGDAAVRLWTDIWLWPAVAAGVILGLFLLLFNDKLTPAQRAGVTDGEANAAALGTTDTEPVA